MISKTKLKQRIKRKTNFELVETLELLKVNSHWNNLIGLVLSSSTRKMPSINLKEIDLVMKEGDIIVVPGKVIGNGDLSKKGKICAMGFSASAIAKLHKAKCPAIKISEEIKSNSKAEGVKVLSWKK
ncbi:MAG: hypothetical protein AABW79_02270 [Nanoarchaeota archaeon]